VRFWGWRVGGVSGADGDEVAGGVELPGYVGDGVLESVAGVLGEADEESVGEWHAPAHRLGDVVDPVGDQRVVLVRLRGPFAAIPPSALVCRGCAVLLRERDRPPEQRPDLGGQHVRVGAALGCVPNVAVGV
jgi:hypothetical protein